MMIIYIS